MLADEINTCVGNFKFSMLVVNKNGSIGSCMQMFTANILGLCDRAESFKNSLSPAKPA